MESLPDSQSQPSHPMLSRSQKREIQEALRRIPEAAVRLFFVRTYLYDRKIRPVVYRIASGNRLDARLKSTLVEQLQELGELRTYSALTEDADGAKFVAEASQEDVDAALRQIREFEGEPVTEPDQLVGCQYYVAEVVCHSDQVIHVFRNLPSKLTATRIKQEGIIFKGGTMELPDESARTIPFSVGIDFVVLGSLLLIVDKTAFEKAMNIRERFVAQTKETIDEIDALGCFAGVDVLHKAVDGHMPLMRQVIDAKKLGHYKDQEFIARLRKLVAEYPSWQVQDKNGRLEITNDNFKVVIMLLRDRRALTLVNQEMIDALVAHKVQ